jgi:hypothetical protein
MNFILKCCKGLTNHTEIDDYIHEWHEGNSELPLYEFLGMTENHYKIFVVKPEELKNIINIYK